MWIWNYQVISLRCYVFVFAMYMGTTVQILNEILNVEQPPMSSVTIAYVMLDIPTIAVGEGLTQGPDIKHSFYLVLSSHVVYCQ